MQEYKKYLAGLLVLGLLLRIYAAMNTPVINTDEIVYMVIAVGTSSSSWARLSTLLHGPVYFYLADFAFRLLGLDDLSARLVSVAFGTASIILVYMIGTELRDRKTALIAAALFAFSAAAATLGSLALFEPLVSTFMLLATWLLIRYMKSGRNYELAGFFAVLAVAINTKVIALYFVPALAVLFFLSKPKVEPRKAVLPLLLFLFLLLPVPAYNYFLYSSKGIMDFHFTSLMGLGQNDEWFVHKTIVGQGRWDVGESLRENVAGLPAAIASYYSIPFLLFIAAGIAYAASSRKTADLFMLAWAAFPLLFFLLYIFHGYYVLYLAPPFALLAASGIAGIAKKVKEADRRTALACMLALFLVGELVLAAGIMKGEDATYRLQDYVQKLPKDSIVTFDDAIWSGKRAWVGASGKQDVMALSEFYSLQQGLSKNEPAGAGEGLVIYYVRCIPDDCGAKDIENTSLGPSHAMNSQLSSQGNPTDEMYQGGKKEYAIYQLVANAQPFGKTERQFMYYDVGHPEKSFDVYSVQGSADGALDALAHAGLWANILLAVAALPFALYLFAGSRFKECFEG